jgi:hypothetical protein
MKPMQARILFNGKVLTALVMMTVFIVMTVMAFDFPPKARLMPLMIGIPGSILGIVQFIIEVLHAKNQVVEEKTESDKQELKDEIHMFIWMMAFFLSILCFGFIYAPPIVVAAFLYFGKKESATIAIVSAICTGAVLYGCFQTWFQIPLFEGLILEWLHG